MAATVAQISHLTFVFVLSARSCSCKSSAEPCLILPNCENRPSYVRGFFFKHDLASGSEVVGRIWFCTEYRTQSTDYCLCMERNRQYHGVGLMDAAHTALLGPLLTYPSALAEHCRSQGAKKKIAALRSTFKQEIYTEYSVHVQCMYFYAQDRRGVRIVCLSCILPV